MQLIRDAKPFVVTEVFLGSDNQIWVRLEEICPRTDWEPGEPDTFLGDEVVISMSKAEALERI
jgi:hypothetical protein